MLIPFEPWETSYILISCTHEQVILGFTDVLLNTTEKKKKKKNSKDLCIALLRILLLCILIYNIYI